MSATPSDAVRSPVLIATDLTEHAEPALLRGRKMAEALGAPFVVVHVIPDVLRHHPLVPSRHENDAVLTVDLEKKAADLVTDQVGRVLRVSADDYRVRIEVGDAEDEIVRVAEEEHAPLVVVGARPRHGTERLLGHVAERVVRYAHGSVLVARPGRHTNELLVATDFAVGAQAALALAHVLVDRAGAQATLLHVMQPPAGASPALVAAGSALGSPWVAPPKAVLDQIAGLGLTMLENLAKEYGLQRYEQLEGDPEHVIVRRAEELGADTVIMGSHGRTGLSRLVLGSVAEHVVRSSTLSVLVARPGTTPVRRV